MADGAEPLLAVEQVSRSFGGNRAVAGVSLAVAASEIVALIGPNGAGKTTLLNLVSGQYRAEAGRIRFAGVDVTRLLPAATARRGMLRGYQDGGVFAKLTAVENVAVPLLARGARHGEAYRLAETALVRLGLGPVLGERAEHLSGGQRKLIDFARALATPARLMLLDEPTTGVHPSVALAMSSLIRERSAAGTAFLIVSHDLPWAFGICRRVVVMVAGEKLVEGPPATVSEDPRVHEAYL
jgi:ABC-type branched-subunit amino acid transport system ATPase component